MKKAILLIVLSIIVSPVFVFAQGGTILNPGAGNGGVPQGPSTDIFYQQQNNQQNAGIGGFSNLGFGIFTIRNAINALIPLVIGFGLLLFLIGITRFVSAGGDEEKRTAGRNMMLFGIVALFVMTSVWGFVKILGLTFFGASGPESRIPSVPRASTQ